MTVSYLRRAAATARTMLSLSVFYILLLTFHALPHGLSILPFNPSAATADDD